MFRAFMRLLESDSWGGEREEYEVKQTTVEANNQMSVAVTVKLQDISPHIFSHYLMFVVDSLWL